MQTPQTVVFHGIEAVRLQTPDGAVAIVALHGAQVLSWLPAGGTEQLFLSERADFSSGAAIRGGVPVIFPQFAERGPGLRHGFARRQRWREIDRRQAENHACVTFRLEADEATHALWPHAFALELTIMIEGRRLDIELEVFNPGQESFQFTAAFHTYLRLGNVELARLEGLEGLEYLEASQAGRRMRDERYALLVDDEVDRIYLRAARPLLLSEPTRQLAIEQSGFTDVVVWNPWQERCATLPDMAPLDFRRMLCVEAGTIAEPVLLPAGEDWYGRQTLVAL